MRLGPWERIRRRRIARIVLPFLLLFPSPPNPEFHNVAAKAGLTHSFPNGGVESKTYILETTGSGAAFFDYDNDGFLDVFLVSGEGGTNRLYRNDGGKRFLETTKQAGLVRSGWGQGVCAGDFDNDGFLDLLVTYWGQNALYRNLGGRTFVDVAARAGLRQDRVRYNSGCAFLDYDRDGDLDIFVANYLKFDFRTAPKPGDNPYCWYRSLPVNCGPRGLPFDTNLLYRNDGNGKFSDVSAASGVSAPGQNYSLGVLTGDFDNDGWVDIYVACDRTPSLLYLNQRNGTFREEGLLRGAALDENGQALSGMGAAAADYDGNGWLDIFRTNFSDERETLYRNRGAGEFDDATAWAGLAPNTRFVGWGCGFFDFDNDGWKDLMLVNGHIFPEVERLKTDIRYRERAILYHNSGDGRFTDISEQAGPGIRERHSARGAAFGDVDNDGAIEVLVNNQNEPPSLLKMSGTSVENRPGNWIIVKLVGTGSNRSAIGARVRLKAQGLVQVDEVRSGGSYLSQNDLRLHFGLGGATIVETLEIDWPRGNGSRGPQVLTGLPVNRVTVIKEPSSPSGDKAR